MSFSYDDSANQPFPEPRSIHIPATFSIHRQSTSHLGKNDQGLTRSKIKRMEELRRTTSLLFMGEDDENSCIRELPPKNNSCGLSFSILRNGASCKHEPLQQTGSWVFRPKEIHNWKWNGCSRTPFH